MVKKYCIKRELLQLLGHINFATRVIIPGRTFVSYLLTLATSAKELEHWVHSIIVKGLIVLCLANGTFNLVKIMVSRAIVRFPSTSGASIVKKSSNKCKIRAIPYLFSAIQHIVECLTE
jgi:hypothetical protein